MEVIGEVLITEQRMMVLIKGQGYQKEEEHF
jgi:hypothetical protein